MKKIIALALVCLLTMVCFISCTDEDVAPESDSVADTTAATEESNNNETTGSETETDPVETDIWTKRY